jgi:putative sigma-54 modulation protein
MNVKIQSVHFDADKKLLDFTETRVGKLERFAEDATGADVTLKIDKDHEHGNKVATIIVSVTGPDLVAEGRARSFEEAVDTAVEALKRQIEKHERK